MSACMLLKASTVVVQLPEQSPPSLIVTVYVPLVSAPGSCVLANTPFAPVHA